MTPDPTRVDALEAEIARLRDLDLPGLQARWKALTRRKAPPHLPKHLLQRLLAYRLQAEDLGDLDRATIRFLEWLATGGRQADASVPLPTARAISPGTLLRREWQGVLHQVEVKESGFSWQETTYRSLSEVARAITGTRWNGPRFFGLREGA